MEYLAPFFAGFTALLALVLLILSLRQRDQQKLEFQVFRETIVNEFHQNRHALTQQQMEQIKLLQDTLQKSFHSVQQQVSDTLKQNTDILTKQFEYLNARIEERLMRMSEQVDKRLNDGFEKTTATFSDVVKRLILIDEAQKKITELSSNVVSLQEILNDKKARGAFGEVQLEILIKNMMPEKSYAFQHTLTNSKRVDCMLFLPPPTGNMAIDAKFPLETYRLLQNPDLDESNRKLYLQQFRQDIKRHIQDIHEKYIVPGETAEGALLFLPAESIFAELHANHGDLIEEAYKKQVWLVSPTTMMAILTTARAVLKDADTRKQVHVIQEHLGMLAKDFERFRKRMENLAKHIDKARDDVQEVQTSANKIANRFERIERVELESLSVQIEEEAL